MTPPSPARQSRRRRPRKPPPCPECGSETVVPVIHGVPGAAQRRAVERNEAVLADREEWEGMTEWYCRACGCDWRGGWRRYKKRADGESLPS